MARFEIERGEPLDHPERWEPAGEAEASGDRAAMDAIDAVAEEARWYRTRIADEPDYPWTYCGVTMTAGEKLIRCPETVAF
jgi:hypothetical protein